jgi:DNA-binding response OmpR family regulator
LDISGDVAAARRALQIGVTDYLLADDLTPPRIDALIQTWRAAGDFDITSNSHRSAHDVRSSGSPPAEADLVYEMESDVDHSLRGARLSSVEAAILNCLSARGGEPMSARHLVNAIMGRDVDEEHAASLIRPHISRLRSKLEPIPQMPRKLLTVRGKGYLYVGD